MEKEISYNIYTDASFENSSKIGTYAIIVTQGNDVLKRIAKRCRMKIKNSTECEVFAIYQAVNLILSVYLKKGVKQKFKLKTDSKITTQFFLNNNKCKTIFAERPELNEAMRKTYNTLCRKVLNNRGSISLSWVPRNSNKMAHNWSYTAFQKLKGYDEKKDILLIDKTAFLEILSNDKIEKAEIMEYLFCNSDDQKIVAKTQKEISEELNISISKINRILNSLIKLNILERIKNGKYAILL